MERYEMLIHMICRYGVSVLQDDWLEELRRIIEHRGKQIEDLVSRIDKLTKERDAAIADLLLLRENPYKTYCDICKNLGNEEMCDKCMDSSEIDFSFFEWRSILG